MGFWREAVLGVLVGLLVAPAIFLAHGESLLWSLAWGIPGGILCGFLSGTYSWATDPFRRRKRGKGKPHRW